MAEKASLNHQDGFQVARLCCTFEVNSPLQHFQIMGGKFRLNMPLYDFASRLVEAQEDMRQKTAKVFGIHSKKDAFHAIAVDDEYYVLFPSEHDIELYRGQNAYHEPSRPSLFRDQKITETERFIERIRVEEFSNLIKTHPAVADLMKPIPELPLNKKLYIDAEGLAQHYQLKTELVDFTSDALVAAFFAVTRYNEKEQRYIPIPQQTHPGVFYQYKMPFLEPGEMTTPYFDRKLQAIGLQPFPRPGEQSAYSYRLGNNNLNDVPLVITNLFMHEKADSYKIYELFEGGEKLFPYDPIQEKTSIIATTNQFSEDAFFSAYRKYGRSLKKVKALKKQMKAQGINLEQKPIQYFSAQEIVDLTDRWNEQRKVFVPKIAFRWAYQ